MDDDKERNESCRRTCRVDNCGHEGPAGDFVHMTKRGGQDVIDKNRKYLNVCKTCYQVRRRITTAVDPQVRSANESWRISSNDNSQAAAAAVLDTVQQLKQHYTFGLQSVSHLVVAWGRGDESM